MSRRTIGILLALALVAILAIPAAASKVFPLEPPNTASPRDTLESFLAYTDRLLAAMRADDPNREKIERAWDMATRCFDLSEVPPTIVDDVALESVLRMREILDRIDLPYMENVPGVAEVKNYQVTFWQIPHSEITIAKVGTGVMSGDFLFTADTVARLGDFYDDVRHLPYMREAGKDGHGIYEEYIYASGWLIPDGVISTLPDWLREGYGGQAVWQWMGLLLVLGGSLGILIVFKRWQNRWLARASCSNWQASRLAFPLLGMGLCGLVEYMLKAQINITGEVLTVVLMGVEGVFFFFAVWGILVLGDVIMRIIISFRHIQEEALDADVIKLVCRLCSFGLVFVVLYRAGIYFGLPVGAVFASAGIAGVAVALAARETLANFFGGVSIFLDGPFRAGDYIVLDSGERGEIQTVGMRSTRLLTRDDVLITIPNSVITNVKIVNQSAPSPNLRFNVEIGVAYDSDVDLVEKVLLEVAKENPLLAEPENATVRLVSFGDSAIQFKIRAMVSHPLDKGRAIHEMNKAIMRHFKKEGISIPFPQRDVRLVSGGQE